MEDKVSELIEKYTIQKDVVYGLLQSCEPQEESKLKSVHRFIQGFIFDLKLLSDEPLPKAREEREEEAN